MKKFLLFLFVISAVPFAFMIVWCRVAWALSVEIENEMSSALKSYASEN
jgi:hypothetical protein